MKKNLRNWTAILLLGASSVMMSGCFGSFNLTRNLWRWNGDVSDNKFVKELVFLGLHVIPAYPLFGFADLIIFNLIEFWTDSNPIAMNPGETTTNSVEYAGTTYQVTSSQNSLVITNEANLTKEFRYFPEEETWFLIEDGAKVAMMKNQKKMFKAMK